MAERVIGVVVDEEFSETNRKFYLRVKLSVNGVVEVGMDASRNANPQEISEGLSEMGYFFKYDECVKELSEDEKERFGDLYIQGSYIVPGL